MFKSFNNTHNGYGSFVDLEAAKVTDAEDFFDRYYAPGNAVLAVAGDLDPAEVRRLVEKHFGGIKPRPVPPPSVLARTGPEEGTAGPKGR